jgi:hypothetical protein
MAKQTDKKQDTGLESLDLSQLSDLSFGPDWASDTGRKRSDDAYRDHDGQDRRHSRPRRRQEGGGSRDRRGNMGGGNREGRDSRGGPGGRREQKPFVPFEPTVDVIFVSQDKPFEVLLKAMRTTFKTYELFEIARIVLGKENRFVSIISAKEDAAERKIYISVPDEMPFETREEAINHVMNNHLEKFFEIEKVEIEPPKGNFQMVNRCKLTGELLGPPNFHRYQEILKDHYSKNIHNMPFERYQERIESVKDDEVIQEWMEKMKYTYQYTVKQKEGEEADKLVLSAIEDVRYYLTTERKGEVFAAKDKVRVPGEKIESMPKSSIRRSIERELEKQRRFPLITSNHLRGRLRRCNLNFFKKGSKGITYVCAVKRRPRYKDTFFSESIQALIEYIEKNPKTLSEELLKNYLPAGVKEITEDTQKSVLQDLRWLVGAGYVTEYGNGTLFADKPLSILAAEDKQSQSPSETRGARGKGKKGKSKDVVESTKEASETVAVEEEKPTAVEETSTPEVVEAPKEVTESPEKEPTAEANEAPKVDPTQEENPVVEVEEPKAEATEPTAVDTLEEEKPVQEDAPAAEEEAPAESVEEPAETETEAKAEPTVEAEVKEPDAEDAAEKPSKA